MQSVSDGNAPPQTEFEGAYYFFVLNHNVNILSACQAGSDECTVSKVHADNTVGLTNTHTCSTAGMTGKKQARRQAWSRTAYMHALSGIN